MKDVSKEDKDITHIPIVREFPDVFPEDILEMSPKREVASRSM